MMNVTMHNTQLSNREPETRNVGTYNLEKQRLSYAAASPPRRVKADDETSTKS